MTDSNRSHDVQLQQQLLLRIGEGESAAFSELYELLSKPIAALAYRILENQQEVEEVLQDVFVAIWNHASDYDPSISRPFSWIVVITKRLCWNRLRTRGRHQRKLDALEAEGTGPVVPLYPEAPDNRVEIKDMSERLKSRLQQFPDKQEAALELSLYEGLTHEEISETLDLPLGTVKTWIRRGILKIRTEMEANL